MTYSDKLRHPKWQKKRLEILNRDDWKCRFCGSEDKNLQVHHVVYKRKDPWDYDNACYQTLCDDCHRERQELTDKAVDALRLSIKDVPTKRLHLVAQQICDDAMGRMS